MATVFWHSTGHPIEADAHGRGRLGAVNDLLEQAWRRGLCSKPSLDPQALLAAARKVTALYDFGAENGWRERLTRLTQSVHEEAALNALGTTIAYGQLVAALASRLRAVALWRRHPQIAQVPLSSPIIIVGQMRSGTTRMQRLLACDERLAFTRFYESWNPVPRWDWLPVDDRPLRGWLALRVAHWLNPNFAVVHPVRAHQPDEEIGLLNIGFSGAAYEAQWRIPGFTRYGESTDSTPLYAEFRRHLQTIKWLRGRPDDRPWILKLPQFSQDLDAVLATFPDARIVALDRDPLHVVASSASLVHNQMIVQSDYVDRAWIGQEALRKVALRQRRTARARQAHTGPVVDVEFAAVQDDWRAEMDRIYAMLDMPFTREVASRMAQYVRRPAHRKLRRHRYDLADFGLTREQVLAKLTNEDRPGRVAA